MFSRTCTHPYLNTCTCLCIRCARRQTLEHARIYKHTISHIYIAYIVHTQAYTDSTLHAVRVKNDTKLLIFSLHDHASKNCQGMWQPLNNKKKTIRIAIYADGFWTRTSHKRGRCLTAYRNDGQSKVNTVFLTLHFRPIGIKKVWIFFHTRCVL